MSEEYTSLGLMSGTSGDGVDASVIKSNGSFKYQIIKDKYYEYDSQIYQEIHSLKEKIHISNDLKTLSKEFIQYCELNDIDKIEELAHDVFERGYTILKFGETPSIARGKEVIKEVEKVVEVEATKKIEELSQKLDKLERQMRKLSYSE